MLETSLLESSGHARRRKPATVLLSIVLHGLVIGALLLVPMAQPQALPLLSAAVGLPLPVVAAKPEIKRDAPSPSPAIQRQITPDPGVLTTPIGIPSNIPMIVDDPVNAIAEIAPIPRGGEVRSLLRRITEAAEPAGVAPPPPPPAPVITHTAPIRVGSISPGSLIRQVPPVYPQIAKITHTQGVVILEATIAKDGTIQNIRVVSGHPLLQQGAIDAVRQWEYKPTVLNGEPVEIITTITVNFTLQ